jgi:hypothetical protein
VRARRKACSAAERERIAAAEAAAMAAARQERMRDKETALAAVLAEIAEARLAKLMGAADE